MYTDLRSPHFAKMVRAKIPIIAIDDYIGSAKTAIDFVEYYRKLFPAHHSQVLVAGLAAMERAISRLDEMKIPICNNLIYKRGISDNQNWTPAQKIQFIAIMEQTETRIGIGADYRLGYGQSEALLRMIRTPNNTMPIFWTTRAVSGVPWPAPFPR